MGKYKIFVDGSSGTTGLRIADRLAEREEFEILKISAADRKDVHARAAVINESDLSFLCLPDDAAREVVPLLREDVRILDTSTAHRTAPGWIYGLPELHSTREALKNATRVAVPGCHATGFIAPVAPLVELGIIPKTAHLSVTSLTGYSGGGKKMIAEYEAERDNTALNAPRLLLDDPVRALGAGIHAVEAVLLKEDRAVRQRRSAREASVRAAARAP